MKRRSGNAKIAAPPSPEQRQRAQELRPLLGQAVELTLAFGSEQNRWPVVGTLSEVTDRALVLREARRVETLASAAGYPALTSMTVPLRWVLRYAEVG